MNANFSKLQNDDDMDVHANTFGNTFGDVPHDISATTVDTDPDAADIKVKEEHNPFPFFISRVDEIVNQIDKSSGVDPIDPFGMDEQQCTNIYTETDEIADVDESSTYASLYVKDHVHVDDDETAFENEVLNLLFTLLAAGFPSRSKQSKTQAQKKRRNKKQKNTNVEQWMDPKKANILISAAIVTWTATLYLYESPAVCKDVLVGSSIVLYICFLGAEILSFLINTDRPFVLAHFVLGLISQCSYIFMYAFRQDEFVYLWRSVFTGYYLFSMLLLVINPKLFFSSFHRFYTLHHSASFFIISAWLIASTDEWPQYLILAKSIWLTSDMWQYIMQIYRAIHNPDSGHFKKLQYLVFSIERVHRCLSYYHALVIGGGASSPFVIFVFATVISIDVFDTVIQINSMRKKK